MSTPPHVLVLGLGIVGSSITATLAERGFRVTAVEQYGPLHERGSSHGDTRIYRRVPHEGALYVDLAARSWDGWKAWGKLAGEDLLVACGGIDAGPAGSEMVTSGRTLCAEYRQPCSSFTGQAFNQQYPVFRLPPAWDVVYQPGSGFVRPDATRAFLHKLATAAHATVRHDAGKAQIDLSSTGVRLQVAGETLTGDLLIVSVGSWLPKILPNLPLAFRTERRVMAWYRPETPFSRTGGNLPIFILDADGVWYGMPTPGGMIKIGNNKHFSEPIDPDQPAKDPDGSDLQRLAPCAQNYLTGLSKMPVALKQCIYTLTDDHHFVIDRHPQYPHVLIFSCCSGHGFKYAPEYGAIAADLISGKPRSDLAPFSLKRTGPATVQFNS